MSTSTVPAGSARCRSSRRCATRAAQCNRRYQGGGPREDARTRSWFRAFARGIGRSRVIIAFEPDSVGTIKCLARSRRKARSRLLRYGVDVLSKLPNATIYIEATASDWVPAARVARALRRIGVHKVRGFMLNTTHYDWTSRNIRYGLDVSRRVGGKPFVVSTHFNGRGPCTTASAAASATCASTSTATLSTAALAFRPPRARSIPRWTPLLDRASRLLRRLVQRRAVARRAMVAAPRPLAGAQSDAAVRPEGGHTVRLGARQVLAARRRRRSAAALTSRASQLHSLTRVPWPDRRGYGSSRPPARAPPSDRRPGGVCQPARRRVLLGRPRVVTGVPGRAAPPGRAAARRRPRSSGRSPTSPSSSGTGAGQVRRAPSARCARTSPASTARCPAPCR